MLFNYGGAINLDLKDENGDTALVRLVSNNSSPSDRELLMDIAILLIKNVVDVNEFPNAKPFVLALARGYDKVVKAFIEK